MQVIKCSREALAAPMQVVSGVVGKNRQTLPILSNVLIEKKGSRIEFTATDLDIEAHTFAEIGGDAPDQSLTVDAAKLNSLLSTLDTKNDVTLEIEKPDAPVVEVRQGKSAFKLNTMHADEFPLHKEVAFEQGFNIPAKELKHAMQLVHYAMAQQDLRYYLNGMYLNIEGDLMKVVTTDGHRLAFNKVTLAKPVESTVSCIVPRRTVMELMRLLPDDDTAVSVELSKSVFCLSFKDITILSKLVEGKFPDYTRVIPAGNKNIFTASRESLMLALRRVSVLANAKLHSLRWQLRENSLKIESANSDREEVTDYIDISYNGDPIDIGFNIMYLQDMLSNLKCEEIQFALSNSTGAMLVTMPDSDAFCYVVMPMRT